MAATSKDLHVLIVGAGKSYAGFGGVNAASKANQGLRNKWIAHRTRLEKGTDFFNVNSILIDIRPNFPSRTNKAPQASIPFSIFESETDTTYQTRPREWGMTLHWGSNHIASCLPPELVARFNEAYADPSQEPDAATGLPIHNGKTGELIMEMTAEKPFRVSRKKMRNLFKEGIDVQYGKEVERAYINDQGQAQVDFKDGTTATGSVLVGSDGAKSRVRESIVGKEAAQLTDVPVSMFNFPYKFDAELAKRIRDQNKLFITSIHPDHGTMFWLSSTFRSLSV